MGGVTVTRSAAASAVTVVAHIDVDAFFAAVEQRDKPSLRGRPVVVGGVGPRGVVATASYEARRFGVGSAMPMAEARRRCPAAAVLTGRFAAYRESSSAVMAVLARYSAAIEQVSLDEAYLTLPADDLAARVAQVRADVHTATGLTASIGVGRTKLVAKIASDDAKPDGSLVVLDDEQAFLDPLPVRRLPGLGPQTQARLARLGIATVGQLRHLDLGEVRGLLGESHGTMLWQLAQGEDERRVQPEHEVKSVSVEETFDTDLTDPVMVETVLRRMAEQVAQRLRASGVSGRTLTVKARYPDFTTINRSATRPGPTNDTRSLTRLALGLVHEIDVGRGVRLLGVGCSGLTSWVQDDLFDLDATDDTGRTDVADVEAGPHSDPGAGHADDGGDGAGGRPPAAASRRPVWRPGHDVVHDDLGRGWVWGSGAGVVTVRYESRHSGPGPVRTTTVDDPALHAADPEPLGEPPAITPSVEQPRRPDAGQPPPLLER
jgi:DNA polymerase-4